MQTIDVDGSQYRYYILESRVPFDEDEVHEYKGHLNFTKDQVPPFAYDAKFDRPSRQPISKTLNAFLNSNRGGIVYLGVANDGKILGVVINCYKMDHIKQNLDDLMRCYDPPVERHRYSLEFIPVISPKSSIDSIKSIVTFDPSTIADEEMRQRPHELHTYKKCWCDKLLAAQTASGLLSPQYILEVTIKPWDPTDPRNDKIAVGKMKAHPIHENEDSRAYCRGGASIREFTVSELQALACRTVLEYYDPVEAKLKQRNSDLIKEISDSLPRAL